MPASPRHKEIHELKLLIIEDDISFATGVEMQLEDFGIKDIATAYTEESALQTIDQFKPDLALVDIRLNHNSDVLTVSKYLKSQNIPFIIMTQYKEENLYKNVSQLAPLAYFTKPLDYIALKYTVDSYFQDLEVGSGREDLIGDNIENFLFVKKGNKYLKVKFEDMIFIQAEGNYVTIQTLKAKFILRGSLKKSLQILPTKMFVQVHRNFVVNFTFVEIYDAENCQLHIEEYAIPVGRSFRSSVRKLLRSSN